MNLKYIITPLFLTSIVVFAQTGYASWYGKKYQGKPTASGEPFDMYDYTASNRTLPFGTVVKVTNLKNNKSVKVRINDRGPTKKSRIIDLSYQAAKDIGLLHDGVVPVEIDIVSTATQEESDNPYLSDNKKTDQEYMKEYASKVPKTKENKIVNVQIASFSSRINAQSFIDKQRDSDYNMKIVEAKRNSKTLYRVVIVCSSENIAISIIKSGRYAGAYILR